MNRVVSAGRLILLSALLAFAPLAGGCASDSTYGPTEVVPLSLVEIVANQSNGVLRPALTRNPALKLDFVAFRDRTPRPATRSDLVAAWNADPALAASVDLEERIFWPLNSGEADGDWLPKLKEANIPPDAVPDRVYVDGFFQGLSSATR